MQNATPNFWQSLVAIGKNILAHVNISYDGSSGSVRIDIIPADAQNCITGNVQLIEQAVIPRKLAAATDEPDNDNGGYEACGEGDS